MKNNKIVEFDSIAKHQRGVNILRFPDKNAEYDHDIYVPHRDTHCLVIVITKGTYKIMIDFEELTINQPAILLIAPGQVHQAIDVIRATSFNIWFDPAIVSATLSDAFNTSLWKNFLIAKDLKLQQQVAVISTLMYDLLKREDRDNTKSIHSLLEALLNLIVGAIAENEEHNIKMQQTKSNISAAKRIEKKFCILLNQHYKTWKKPAQYAVAMNVSLSHLSNTIKLITGHPVSNHIQRQSIVEAKRLLYFSDLSIKEISYKIGYEDPAYFSRLFKKATKETPLQFRQRFLD